MDRFQRTRLINPLCKPLPLLLLLLLQSVSQLLNVNKDTLKVPFVVNVAY